MSSCWSFSSTTQDLQHGPVEVPAGGESFLAALGQPLPQSFLITRGLIEQAVGGQEQFVTVIQAPGILVPASHLQAQQTAGEGVEFRLVDLRTPQDRL